MMGSGVEAWVEVVLRGRLMVATVVGAAGWCAVDRRG